MKNNNDDDDDYVSKKRPLTKVLWYMPIIQRLKKLFANVNNANNIICHDDEKNVMETFVMLMILCSRRKLIYCILILAMRQETIGLNLTLI